MDKFLEIVELMQGQVKLAEALKRIKPNSKIQQGHINNWINRSGYVPAEWVIPSCQVVEWQVTPHELRPDLYPHPQDGLPETLRVAA